MLELFENSVRKVFILFLLCDLSLLRRVPMTRSKLDIFAEVLETAKVAKTKTAIVSQVNLNQQLATSTLKLLVDLGLVSEGRNSPTAYLTSERGLRFLQEYQNLQRTLESK